MRGMDDQTLYSLPQTQVFSKEKIPMAIIPLMGFILLAPMRALDSSALDNLRSEARQANERLVDQAEKNINSLYELRISVLELWQIEEIFDRVENIYGDLMHIPADLLSKQYSDKYALLKKRLDAFKDQVMGRLEEIAGRSETRRSA